MVRLKEEMSCCWGLFLKHFNSTMVRLKVFYFELYENTCKEFQFHYGSVKSYFCLLCWQFNIKFQFHYGSVKSLLLKFVFDNFFWFQFHYGSVKSKYVFVPNLQLLNFNSTMVRLKVLCSCCVSCNAQNFNSTMVRLKGYRFDETSCGNYISIPLWFG